MGRSLPLKNENLRSGRNNDNRRRSNLTPQYIPETISQETTSLYSKTIVLPRNGITGVRNPPPTPGVTAQQQSSNTLIFIILMYFITYSSSSCSSLFLLLAEEVKEIIVVKVRIILVRVLIRNG